MIKASIDIGSNTVQFLIAEVSGNTIKQLVREQFVTSLGRGIDKTGGFDKKSMEDTFSALEKCRDLAVKNKAQSIIMTATEASRLANNSGKFYEKVEAELGLKVRLLSSYEEAYYSTKGLLSSGKIQSNFSVFDIGGASTELSKVQFNPYEILDTISFRVGSVRMKNWGEARSKKVSSQFDSINWKDYQGLPVYGIAGTITSIACMLQGVGEFNEVKADDFRILINRLNELYGRLRKKTTEEILEEFPFLGKRAEVILFGVEITLSIADRLNVKEIVSSTKGLVQGTILSL